MQNWLTKFDGPPALPDAPAPAGFRAAGVQDGPLAAYMHAASPAFDALRRAAAQMAGAILFASLGGGETPDHAMLNRAREVWRGASDSLAALRPPEAARHHHAHLTASAESLGAALSLAAETADRRLDQAVQRAVNHLRWAGQALPGFEIVDFTQGCAYHPGGEG